MRILFYYADGENIGIEHLSAYLKSKGHTIDLIFDPRLGDNFYLNLPILNRLCSDELIMKKARRFKPDLIAISSITNNYLIMKNIAKKLKVTLNVPIIIGGIHPSSVPEEVIKEDCFDIVCVGEGEEAFAELLEKLKKKKSILKIKNLWVKDKNKKIHKNKLRPLIKNLDKLPFADKFLFYKYGVVGSRIVVTTTRGCPFQCTFCGNTLIKKIYKSQNYFRRRSVDNVIKELVILKRNYKPKAFRFVDDLFTYNLDWLKEFRVKYVKYVDLPFQCSLTPTTAGDAVLKELKLAGCRWINMGVQSGSYRIRSEIYKRYHSNEIIIEAAKRINKYKLKLIAEFIFGAPTETPKEMMETLELSEKLNVYCAPSFILYPFPKTELFDYCLKHGYLTKKNYEKIVNRGEGSYHTTCFLEHPYKDEIFKFNSILPIYAKSPRILKLVFRQILKMKYGLIHKTIYIFSIPFIDFDEFFIRIEQLPKMIIRARKILNKY